MSKEFENARGEITWAGDICLNLKPDAFTGTAVLETIPYTETFPVDGMSELYTGLDSSESFTINGAEKRSDLKSYWKNIILPSAMQEEGWTMVSVIENEEPELYLTNEQLGAEVTLCYSKLHSWCMIMSKSALQFEMFALGTDRDYRKSYVLPLKVVSDENGDFRMELVAPPSQVSRGIRIYSMKYYLKTNLLICDSSYGFHAFLVHNNRSITFLMSQKDRNASRNMM